MSKPPYPALKTDFVGGISRYQSKQNLAGHLRLQLKDELQYLCRRHGSANIP